MYALIDSRYIFYLKKSVFKTTIFFEASTAMSLYEHLINLITYHKLDYS